MFRATIGYLISVQFRYIPIIFALILVIPLSMVDFSVEISFFFTLVLLLGLFCITYHKGFLLNTKINEYQIYTGFWGLKFGSWQPLPEVSQIYVSRGGVCFNSTIGLINYGNVSATAVFVVLHTQDGKKIAVASTGGKVAALKLAQKLHKNLKTTICDHTGRERTYLEYSP